MILDGIILQREVAAKEQVTETSKNKDSIKKSLIKTVSWRIVGTLDTVAISWLLTGKLDVAFSIGSIELVTKMALYYLHERVWNKIK